MKVINPFDDAVYEVLNGKHSKIANIIQNEALRQQENIELIASENYPSFEVRAAMSSVFQNKYAEGYPLARYYGGCEYIDELEAYCQEEWLKVFNVTDSYKVNVQPHSGSQANMAAYRAILHNGDTVMSLGLNEGGHLTHGSAVNFSGHDYNFIHYGLNGEGRINYEELYNLAQTYKPKLIIAGASAYSREINFDIFRMVADDVGAFFMVDMAHIAGLIAAGDHKNPFGLADIITTTTHKTLRGPRGGLIFCKPELFKKVNSAVFPGIQGGPLEHVIAAKAICAEEAQTDEYKNYIHQVVKNSKAFAEEMQKRGYDIVTGGTDNHMFLIDFSKTHPRLTGARVQDELDKHNITLNKNCVPNERRSVIQTSGVRIGTPAMTTRGWDVEDFTNAAEKIDRIIKNIGD